MKKTTQTLRFGLLTLAALATIHLSTPAVATATEPGEAAPNFELHTLDGEKHSLQSFRGNIVLVSFWASWCPPCKDEFPELDRIAAEYKSRGIRVLAISIDKARSNVRRFLEVDGHDVDKLSLTLLRDPEAKTVANFNTRAMPTSFIIDRDGVVRHVHPGFQPSIALEWRKEIDALLAQTDGHRG